MSKITIPLLMIFAAIGFAALAMLDRDGEQSHEQRWPTKIAPPKKNEVTEAQALISIEEQLSSKDFERLTNRELANIRLLPLDEKSSPVSFLWPSDANDEPAQPELLDFAQRRSFENWKGYADEHIGFYYPDFPGVRVEVVGTTDRFPVFGETMLPPEPGAFRKYRITAGETGTLCVITLAHANGFDDYPRAPHPEVFHRFTPSGGGMLRTAFTEQGKVRRVELLARDVRASLLDSPHVAIHEDIYLRIATSLQLSGPFTKWDDLKKSVINKYGIEGKLGFLDHGVPTSEVISILGQPTARDPQLGTLEYFRTDGPKTIFYTLGLHSDMFAGFDSGWRQVTRSAPVDGTIRWMFEKTEYRVGEAGGVGYSLGALTDADAQAIFDRVVELAPSAGSGDWPRLCDIVANLAQHGLHDERLIEIARVKLQSPTLPPEPALLVLEACDSSLAKAAIAEHIIASFAASKLDPQSLEHFYTLIAYLGKSHPASAQLIDRALRHESDEVRELGFKYCSWLPEKFAIPHLEAGLHDSSTEVRRRCASAFAGSHGDPERHPKILTICLSEENDEEVKLLLREALARLEATSGS